MLAVPSRRSIDAGEDRLGGGPTAVHRLGDAFTLQRIHQTGGIADDEHAIARGRGADQTHLEPSTQRPPSRTVARVIAENADTRRVFEAGVEVACRAAARRPVGD